MTPVNRGSNLNMLFNFGKKAPAPAPSKVQQKAPPAPVVPQFANGLVGSDVEAPEFDPLQLSAGRSEETIAWYRAAELKVSPHFHNIFSSMHWLIKVLFL